MTLPDMNPLPLSLAMLFLGLALPLHGQENHYRWKITRNFDDIRGPKQTLELVTPTESLRVLEHQPVGYKSLQAPGWKSYGLPLDALLACHGWWAGYGQTIYIIKGKSHLEIHFRELHEQAPLEGFELIAKVFFNGK